MFLKNCLHYCGLFMAVSISRSKNKMVLSIFNFQNYCLKLSLTQRALFSALEMFSSIRTFFLFFSSSSAFPISGLRVSPFLFPHTAPVWKGGSLPSQRHSRLHSDFVGLLCMLGRAYLYEVGPRKLSF